MPYSENARELLQAIIEERGIRAGQVAKGLTTHTKRDAEALEAGRLFYKELLPGIDADTIEGFMITNQTQQSMEEVYGPQALLTFVSQEEMGTIFADDDGWKRFRLRFPDSAGVLDLSQPAFSAEGKNALVEIGQQQDWLAGAGGGVQYAKSDGVWKKVGSHVTWIS
jgi:hypothetical protein